MEIRSGRILWRHPTTTSMTSAALTTGGGLVLVGDASRYLYVHDVTTGKVLFQTRLPVPVQGFPVTYAVGGRQYIAVPVGAGGYIGQEADAGGSSANAIYVFALPGSGPSR
jgi:alcohol dehydrogenase (cytochrome c)